MSGINYKRYPCPCCEFLTRWTDMTDTDYICPVCFWQDDAVALKKPDIPGGPNPVSLNEARRNFKRFGAIEERFVQSVRKPLPEEIPPGKK